LKSISLTSECPLVAIGLQSLLGENHRVTFQDRQSVPTTGNSTDLAIYVFHDLRSGTEQFEDAVSSCGRQPTLLLFGSYDRAAIEFFLQKGVNGCLFRLQDSAEVKLAVEELLGGRRYFSHSLANVMMNSFSGSSDNQISRGQLSRRENEVLDRILAGQSNTFIAKDLGISDKTVSSYKARIFEKLNLATNADLFKLASKSGWMSEISS
jgi:DNA-binding NarL/FixJ family response regulator